MTIVTFPLSDKITRYPFMAESRCSASISHKNKILIFGASRKSHTYFPNKPSEGKIGWKCNLHEVDA